MGKLEVFDVYNQFNENETEGFLNQIDSSMRVVSDYDKIDDDTEWIDMMEMTIPYLDNILRNPNRFIINEEEIVKVELARKITVDSIKHLSKNTNLIQDINKKTGDVRPSKILNINKEESYDTYENKFIYSLIQNMRFYVSRKKGQVTAKANDSKEKNDKKIEYNGSTKAQNKKVNINMSLDTHYDASGNRKKGKEETPEERIEILERKIMDLTSSEVYKMIDKKHISLVTSPIKKTNVILKNVNFQYALKLWNYLQTHVDFNPTHVSEKKDYMDNGELKRLVDETFLLNYLILENMDKDKIENEVSEKNLQEKTIEKMVERMVDINSDIPIEELQKMVDSAYTIIKYKKMLAIQELQKVFKKHIYKYLSRIGQQ